MKTGRLVAVEASERGSGYVIGPRLILTSAHVVPSVGGRVMVFGLLTPGVWEGEVVWRGTPRGRDDAALVAVRDSGWQPPAGDPPRWGRVVTNRPGIPGYAWGFPRWVQRQGEAVDTWQPSGTLNPGNRYIGDRYVLTVDGTPPAPIDPGTSPWAGLSGAALFCGDLLTGVLTRDLSDGRNGHLEAVPAYLLARDTAFREAAARHGMTSLLLEPVEAQDLAETEPPIGGSPAALLRARHQVVSFRGRDQLLADLLAWCNQPGFAAWLLYGPGGQGKTRLAQELAHRLGEQRWAWLWLSAKSPNAALKVLGDVTVPLLIIVDYAEHRTPQIAAALRECARHSGDTPLRMLLLARTAGDWWQELQDANPHAEALLDGSPVISLPELEPEPDGRASAYRQAVTDLAHALTVSPRQNDHDWPAITAQLTAINTVSWDQPATALTLHMTALADLLDTAEETPPDLGPVVEPGTVEDRLLRHERRYWRDCAVDAGLLPRRDWPPSGIDESTSKPGEQTLNEDALFDAMAAAMLLGPDIRYEADMMLYNLKSLHDESTDRRNAVRDWIAQLYPPVDTRPWGRLEPDRLAERFTGIRLQAFPSLLDPLLADATDAQAHQLLTVYGRAAHQRAFAGRLDQQLTDLCIRHADNLALAATDVATQIEAPGPLVAALRQLAADPQTPIRRLADMASRVPEASHSLAVYAAELTQRLVAEYRRLAASDPDAFQPHLSWWLTNLSATLDKLGRVEEGMAPGEEAVAMNRELAAADPDKFLPYLARSLTQLSVNLGRLGRPAEALTASDEAVQLYRQLSADHPHAVLPYLAGSMVPFASSLAAMTRPEDAIAASKEAVAINRRLAAANPDKFLPNLAGSLETLAAWLLGVRRLDEALAVGDEAVQIYQKLAAARPDAFLPGLARSFFSLAMAMSEMGQFEDAFSACERSVRIYRQLVAERPDTFLPDLARSLNSLSVDLANLGQLEDGLNASEEAVRHYRQLAAGRPDAFLSELARSLTTHANYLGNLGQLEETLATIEEAVQIYRQLAAGRPEVFLRDLANSLVILAPALAMLERVEEGLAAAEEAVQIYRQSAAARPDAIPDLARSLPILSKALGDLDRLEEALAIIEEAVGLYWQLAMTRPDAYLPALAESLNDLAISLGMLERPEEGVAASEEAVTIYRQLAVARPGAYRDDLARSLCNLAIGLDELDRLKDALAAGKEAVAILQQLAAVRPDVYRPDLIQARAMLGELKDRDIG